MMGTRRLASFLNKAGKEVRPEIEESSVFTVRLPGENMTFTRFTIFSVSKRLITPEYSFVSFFIKSAVRKEACLFK